MEIYPTHSRTRNALRDRGIFFRGGKRRTQVQGVELDGDGAFSVRVTGARHYQREFSKIAGGKTEDGHELRCPAILLPQDDNPHDPKAVAILIENEVMAT